MSQQQMNPEEMGRGYQAQVQYTPGNEQSYGPGVGLDDSLGSFSGQKIGQYNVGKAASAGQRLALAIVSICMLVPLTAIVLGIASGLGPFGVITGLIALGVLCLAITAVNVVFNLAGFRH